MISSSSSCSAVFSHIGLRLIGICCHLPPQLSPPSFSSVLSCLLLPPQSSVVPSLLHRSQLSPFPADLSCPLPPPQSSAVPSLLLSPQLSSPSSVLSCPLPPPQSSAVPSPCSSVFSCPLPPPQSSAVLSFLSPQLSPPYSSVRLSCPLPPPQTSAVPIPHSFSLHPPQTSAVLSFLSPQLSLLGLLSHLMSPSSFSSLVLSCPVSPPTPQQTSSSGLRHPSLEEGAGKRCSECASSAVLSPLRFSSHQSSYPRPSPLP